MLKRKLNIFYRSDFKGTLVFIPGDRGTEWLDHGAAGFGGDPAGLPCGSPLHGQSHGGNERRFALSAHGNAGVGSLVERALVHRLRGAGVRNLTSTEY